MDELGVKLCELLGLNPETVYWVSVECSAGGEPRIDVKHRNITPQGVDVKMEHYKLVPVEVPA